MKKAINVVESDSANGTFKCPKCEGKVLSNTGYCPSCKKKVKPESKKEKIITVEKEVQIGNIILEKGDKFRILNEDSKSTIVKAFKDIKEYIAEVLADEGAEGEEGYIPEIAIAIAKELKVWDNKEEDVIQKYSFDTSDLWGFVMNFIEKKLKELIKEEVWYEELKKAAYEKFKKAIADGDKNI